MAFPSVFPGDIDSYVRKTDGIDDVMAVDVNELQSAIEAIEATLHADSYPPTFTNGQTTIVTFGAGSRTYTFPNYTGTVALGADTLSATSANAFTTSALHTHAITSVNVATAAANILACDANGRLQVLGLGIGAFYTNTAMTVAGTITGAGIVVGLYCESTMTPANGSDAYGGYLNVRVATGAANVIPLSYGWYIGPILKNGTGTMTTTYGLRVEKSTTATTNYGAYIDGNVGIANAAPAYTLDVTGNIRCSTGFGCNGATPQTAYSLGAASSDLATVVALANKLRLMAIGNGTGSA